MRIRFGRWICAILVILLVFCGTAFASSVEDDASEAKFLYGESEKNAEANNADIYEFKRKLNEEGFYTADISDEELNSYVLDSKTMAAVRKVTEYNPDLTYYQDGVSNQLYWRVMGKQGELKSPKSESDTTLYLGDQGDKITEIQNQLSQLGYGSDFTEGVYDEKMQEAVNLFVKSNKLVYQQEDCIPETLQAEILDEKAAAYSGKLSFSEKILAYFGGTAAIGGFAVPVWAFWAVGFVLLCVIVLLLLRLFGKKGDSKNGQQPKTSDSVNPDIRPGKGEVMFWIEYNGMRRIHKARIKDGILIGRSQGNFPLNPEDVSVSRMQCELIPDSGKLRLRNRSAHGTVLNGDRLQSMGDVQGDDRFVHNGDVIEFGRHKVTVFYQE